MLSNAYFLAKFRFDTAENEPAKKLQKLSEKIAKFATSDLDLIADRDLVAHGPDVAGLDLRDVDEALDARVLELHEGAEALDGNHGAGEEDLH